jgi:hypothetical protein
LVKKARRAKLLRPPGTRRKPSKPQVAQALFDLVLAAQSHGWSAEDLLRQETLRRERQWRAAERKLNP